MGRRQFTDTERLSSFFRRVTKTDICWIWSGGVANNYGRFWDGSSLVAAHRFSYAIFKGPIPSGLLVLHECDNSLCVNPAHLSVGDQSKNIQDCILRGRGKNIGRHSPITGTRRHKVRKARVICKRGHDLTAYNSTYISHGNTYKTPSCRLCKNENERRYMARKKKNAKKSASKKQK